MFGPTRYGQKICEGKVWSQLEYTKGFHKKPPLREILESLTKVRTFSKKMDSPPTF